MKPKLMVGAVVAFLGYLGVAWLWVRLYEVNWERAMVGVLLWNQVWDQVWEHSQKLAAEEGTKGG